MNKLSSETYKRLVAQAEEAKELQLDELAERVLASVGATPREEEGMEPFTFSYAELRESVHQSLWKVAVEVIAYHDVGKADIQRIGQTIDELTETVLIAVEESLSASNTVGPNEPKLFGEKR